MSGLDSLPLMKRTVTIPRLVNSSVRRYLVDGDHYGYLVHAPELEADDYPFATSVRWIPMASLSKGGTYEGLVSIMSFWGKSEAHPDGPEWEAHKKNFVKKRRKEIKVQKAINVPKGWRFSGIVPTAWACWHPNRSSIQTKVAAFKPYSPSSVT